MVGTALLTFSALASDAQADVYWGWDAPTVQQSGMGRADQSGAGVSARLFSIPSANLLTDKYEALPEQKQRGGMTLAGGYVYWGWYAPTLDQSGIGRAKLNGSDVSNRYVSLGGYDHVGGVAVQGNYIYWSWNRPTSDQAGIGRAELNGSHVDDGFISLSSADLMSGLAANGDYLYWGWSAPTRDAAGIGRVKLNGSDAANGFLGLPSSDELGGVALDSSYIYWGWHAPTADQTGIGRAKLNGSAAKNGFIGVSVADIPAGIGVDNDYIYWGWQGPTIDQSGIGRADLNGSHVKGRFVSVSGADDIGGIAVGGPPNNITAPSVSGTTREGQSLTEKHGTWLNAVSSYKYQWERCSATGGSCKAIANKTTNRYTLQAADVGHRMRVHETAVNASGDSSTVSSAATAVVLPLAPKASTLPGIEIFDGTPIVGKLILEDHAGWSGDPTSYAYQWQLCDSNGLNCTAISGANGEDFTIVAGDAGDTLRVQETASNAGGTGAPVVSAATPVVLPQPPAVVIAPSIAGDLYGGQTLSVAPAYWSNDPTSVQYLWQLCNVNGVGCGPIAGATGSTYVVPTADEGGTIAVVETASNAGGSSAAEMSSVSGVIGSFNPEVGAFAPISSLAPTIVGTPGVGETLEASSGAWEGSPTLTYAYQWQTCSGSACSNITDATQSAYVVASTAAGQDVRVEVQAHNSAGSSPEVASNSISIP
jgi:hypothetical protein